MRRPALNFLVDGAAFVGAVGLVSTGLVLHFLYQLQQER